MASRISDEMAAMVRAAAPALAAIRVAAGRTASAFAWRPGLIVTSALAVGASLTASVATPGSRAVVAERANMVEHSGLAAFRIPGRELQPTLVRAETPANVGAFVLALGAGSDASPTARLMLVREAAPGCLLLDGLAEPAAEGGPVLDMAGKLLGMSVVAADGGCAMVPWRAIAQSVEPPPRGWLGAVFQPTTVPLRVRAEAGQGSARRVTRIAAGGPADRAGLRVGDVLLALDGSSMSGTGAVRRFLSEMPAGRRVAARMLRGGRIATVTLTLDADPNAPV